MRANDPKVVFRAPRELRSRMELFKVEMERRTGRSLSMSRVLNAILEDFFESQSRSSKAPPLAFEEAGGKK